MLKWPLSLAAALLVSLGLFHFIQQLISGEQPSLRSSDTPAVVLQKVPEIINPDEALQPPPPEPVPEPQMPTSEPAIATPSPELSAPAISSLFTSDSGIAIGAGGAGQAVDVAAAPALKAEFGEHRREGFIEITPFATRQPNIPKVAWEHQLSGWVVVIFNVDQAGKTHNIRVLDAQPKGIFEQEVIRAVSYWRYDMSRWPADDELILTQKIQLDWQHYPQNNPYSYGG